MKNNIFKKDKNGNTTYRAYSFGGKHIVNDINIQNKLLDIEEYREYIFSYRPIIMMPILVISFAIGVILSFTAKLSLDPKQIMGLIALSLYLMSCVIFYYKIYKILKKNKYESPI
ncbi:MAG: hypothetical protein ACWGHH_08760 [Sulfurovaceae bacterium]